ncbi:excinuclease ABC subunit B [Flavobacterium circumlabens]|uniref:Excinuclease ABC subunit B n=1 Tax=Flavobacterium circumlabens TaxID=2133765 RepID=A0A4Y7UDH7_9FLAO|nr:TerB family tellurite resistance protein [Flavobacterium circumlabens]TCN57540.1 tellurite resistance protein TerB [Flavobacterium circumlabens]TEB43852.1 excinuclease ABC subunit B [Flavobacterium circumlabens]
MDTEEQKRSLLLEMIVFSTVDGQLHKRELDFLWLVAQELNFDKKDFQDLFHQETPPLNIKSEFQRIQQFYRLALIMHCDGILHEKEAKAIQQIAIEMGLNLNATKRILDLMNKAPNAMLDPKLLLKVFQEQHN